MPGTTRSATTEARREKIVEAAAMCFIRKGFHQSSMRDIASAAGVSLGNLYNHFANKEALIAEIAALEARELADLERALERNGTTLDVLSTFLKRYLSYLALPENISLGAEILAEATRNPDVAAGFKRNRSGLADRIAQRIEAGISSGDISTEIDPAHAAEFIIDLAEGCAFRTAMSSRSNIRSTSRHLLTLLERYLSP